MRVTFGRLDIGVKISIKGNCLEQRIPVLLGKHHASIITPSAKYSNDDPKLVIPENGKLNEQVLKRLGRHNSEFPWGAIFSYNTGTSEIIGASISSFLLHIEQISGDDITYSNYLHGRGRPESEVLFLKELWQGADQWIALFRRWIAVLSDQHTNPLQPITNLESEASSLEILTVEKEIVSLPSSGSDAITIFMEDEESSLDVSTLRIACEAASNKIEPHISHEFIAEAKTAFRRKEFRKAVIDACTATELILNLLLTEELNKLPKNVSTALLSERRTLGPLSKLVSKFKDLPNDMEVLLKTRNSVVHRGLSPDKTEALAVLDVAKAIGKMLPNAQ